MSTKEVRELIEAMLEQAEKGDGCRPCGKCPLSKKRPAAAEPAAPKAKTTTERRELMARALTPLHKSVVDKEAEVRDEVRRVLESSAFAVAADRYINKGAAPPGFAVPTAFAYIALNELAAHGLFTTDEVDGGDTTLRITNVAGWIRGNTPSQ